MEFSAMVTQTPDPVSFGKDQLWQTYHDQIENILNNVLVKSTYSQAYESIGECDEAKEDCFLPNNKYSMFI